MNKNGFLLCALLTLLTLPACIDESLDYETFEVPVTLSNPITGSHISDVSVFITSTSGNVWNASTGADGIANFSIPAGVYSISASASYTDENGVSYLLNLSSNEICISADSCKNGIDPLEFTLSSSRKGSLVIKELYNGGCRKDDGSGTYRFDQYCTIYNNGQTPVTMRHLCLGMAAPYNAHGNNGNYKQGVLTYANEGFIPAIQAIWYFQDSITLQSNEQLTIAIDGAIDHTKTYSNSIDLSKGEYYCNYDPLTFTNTSYYPVPSTLIPQSHYLKAAFYGQGTAWPLSTSAPAFFIFNIPDSITPMAFAADNGNIWYSEGKSSPIYACLKIPTEWIVDAIEVFTTTSSQNRKRLTDAVDAGAAYLTNQCGYTLHRIVDTKATLAIEGNAGKIVYGLPSTPDGAANVVVCDPAGINAEASVRNGAVIIYQDTNNSNNDFFERYQSALRD